MFGTLSLSKDGGTLTINYVESGVLPPEITVSASGVQLKAAGK